MADQSVNIFKWISWGLISSGMACIACSFIVVAVPGILFGVGAFCMIFGVLFLFSMAITNRRTRVVTAMAISQGLDFVEFPSAEQRQHVIENSWLNYSVPADSIQNFITGARDGMQVSVFDATNFGLGMGYSYSVLTVLCVQLSPDTFPAFIVGPHRRQLWLDGVDGRRSQSITLNTFSRLVLSDKNDEALVTTLLNPDILATIASQPDLYIECRQDRFLLYAPGVQLIKLLPRLDFAINIAKKLQSSFAEKKTQLAEAETLNTLTQPSSAASSAL